MSNSEKLEMTLHRPTPRPLTLGLSPMPNRKICGFTFGYAQIPQSGTSHIPGTLSEFTPSRLKKKVKKKILKRKGGNKL